MSISILRVKIFFPLPFTAHPKQLRLTMTKMPQKQEKNVFTPVEVVQNFCTCSLHRLFNYVSPKGLLY